MTTRKRSLRDKDKANIHSSTNMPVINNPVRVSLISASLGIALIAVLATYLRRKRRRRPTYRGSKGHSSEVSEKGDGPRQTSFFRSKRGRSPTIANGDLAHRRQNSVNSQQVHLSSHGGSTSSINTTDNKLSGLSGATLTEVQDTSKLNPEQLCDLGMEALQTAITHWEDALERLEEYERVTEKGDHIIINSTLQSQLQQLLCRAYNIQNHYEQKMLTKVNANVAMDSAVNALTEMDRAYEDSRRSNTASLHDDVSSDQDSFVSATDMADLSDLEDQKETHHHLVLYEAALLELTHGNIPCRTLRTKMVNCFSDTEFLSKLFCVRLAFMELFKDETIRNFFADSGRQMIADLLTQADRDPEDFQVAYDQMLHFITNDENWPDVETELRGRGVKAMNFFDIVIDFILFDAFDDLESPPSSVTSVVQNRWLSNGFKETALSTAVWSVLKAKRRMLKFQKGFIAHFYAISEHTSPVLAWGFLGPDGHLKNLCTYFKDQVLGLMRDIFSFEKVRYTTLEQLTDDILRLAKKRVAIASAKLSSF